MDITIADRYFAGYASFVVRYTLVETF